MQSVPYPLIHSELLPVSKAFFLTNPHPKGQFQQVGKSFGCFQNRIRFLCASPSSQGILELSYFGHGKAFLRSNDISLQLRIRKQTELIRKRREIDFASKELQTRSDTLTYAIHNKNQLPQRGIEPRSPVCEAKTLPLSLAASVGNEGQNC